MFLNIDYHYVLIFTFLLGYALIIFENAFNINKSAISLLTGVALWFLYLQFDPNQFNNKIDQLFSNLSDISQLILFLIGTMTVVELIVAHQGFEIIKQAIMIPSPRKLFWMLSFIGFWMSSVLDNLTTILVLVSLIRNTVQDVKMRKILAAGLVFAVNVGGAWTPIGDITTTMLWIEGRVNTLPLMKSIGLPSIISMLIFVALYTMTIPKSKIQLFLKKTNVLPVGSKLVFFLGVGGLLIVPLMKLAFDLPPFMGMLISLAVIWVITDRLHLKHEERKELVVENILTKIDISCILFFLGILLAVGSLDSAGILDWIAVQSRVYLENPYLFTMVIGILSSLVDNVPLVAGIINMYDLSIYPTDHIFWSLSAYCAGVGGSLLIIGSAPGVALMSLKKIEFFWYLKRVSWAVLISYLSGWGFIYLLNRIYEY